MNDKSSQGQVRTELRDPKDNDKRVGYRCDQPHRINFTRHVALSVTRIGTCGAIFLSGIVPMISQPETVVWKKKKKKEEKKSEFKSNTTDNFRVFLANQRHFAKGFV